MNEYLNTTLKVIVFLVVGFTVNAGMTLLSAPGHTGTALVAGVFLTSFGFFFAKYAMEIVILPIGVLSLIYRWLRGNKVKQKPRKGGDRIDFFGRVLFVATYSFISSIFGLYVGVQDGGMGWFMSAAMFGTAGVLLALLVPNDLLWAAEGDDANVATPTEAGKADMDQARRDGVPAVLFADRVAKVVVKAVTEINGTDKRR